MFLHCLECSISWTASLWFKKLTITLSLSSLTVILESEITLMIVKSLLNLLIEAFYWIIFQSTRPWNLFWIISSLPKSWCLFGSFGIMESLVIKFNNVKLWWLLSALHVLRVLLKRQITFFWTTLWWITFGNMYLLSLVTHFWVPTSENVSPFIGGFLLRILIKQFTLLLYLLQLLLFLGVMANS